MRVVGRRIGSSTDGPRPVRAGGSGEGLNAGQTRKLINSFTHVPGDRGFESATARCRCVAAARSGPPLEPGAGCGLRPPSRGPIRGSGPSCPRIRTSSRPAEFDRAGDTHLTMTTRSDMLALRSSILYRKSKLCTWDSRAARLPRTGRGLGGPPRAPVVPRLGGVGIPSTCPGPMKRAAIDPEEVAGPMDRDPDRLGQQVVFP
jgi:hypothetical protein